MKELNDYFINFLLTLKRIRNQDLSPSEHVVISKIENMITQQINDAEILLNDIHYHFKESSKDED